MAEKSGKSLESMETVEGRSSNNNSVRRFFRVEGKVQRVMFRQTVIRAMIKHHLDGGASNDPKDRHLVHLTMEGDDEQIEELVDLLRSKVKLNSWGAQATSVKEVDAGKGKRIAMHQVTTRNVDAHKWNPNVTMYI